MNLLTHLSSTSTRHPEPVQSPSTFKLHFGPLHISLSHQLESSLDKSAATRSITKVPTVLHRQIRAATITFAARINDIVAPPVNGKVTVLGDGEAKEDYEGRDGDTGREGTGEDVVVLGPEGRELFTDVLEGEERDVDVADKVALYR